MYVRKCVCVCVCYALSEPPGGGGIVDVAKRILIGSAARLCFAKKKKLIGAKFQSRLRLLSHGAAIGAKGFPNLTSY